MHLSLNRLLTPGQVAQILGVTTEFVRGEVLDGRLHAVVSIRRPSGYTLRRFAVGDLRTYVVLYSPAVMERLECST